MIGNDISRESLKAAIDSKSNRIITVSSSWKSNTGNILSWLAGFEEIPIIYFSKPKQTIQYIGIGQWDILDNKSALNLLNSEKENNEIRLYGANSFFGLNSEFADNDCIEQYWVLPKISLEVRPNQIKQTIAMDLNSGSNDVVIEEIMSLVSLLKVEKKKSTNNFYFDSITHQPDEPKWESSVNKVKRLIEANKLEKVVLARKTNFKFTQTVNPFLILKSIQYTDPNVYHFCFTHNKDHSFIGGTPERLFELDNQHIESDAIAGTRMKNNDQLLDNTKKELLTSSKDQHEHKFVVDHINAQLQKICDETSFNEYPTTIELKYLVHLIVTFKGVLKPGVQWLQCLNALHPTPAVAGTPLSEAISCIRSLEPFERDWYAGPVGTVTQNTAQILVAIRSGIVSGDSVSLFAGAGIVKESNPQSEWDELDAKIRLFTALFDKNQLDG